MVRGTGVDSDTLPRHISFQVRDDREIREMEEDSNSLDQTVGSRSTRESHLPQDTSRSILDGDEIE